MNFYSCITTSSPGAAGACSLPSAVCASSAFTTASTGASSFGPSSGSPRLLLQALNNPSTFSFSHTLKSPLFAGPEIPRFSISGEGDPMMAMEVLLMLRCLSCCRVSWRAERPWLISAGRSARSGWLTSGRGADGIVSTQVDTIQRIPTFHESLVVLLEVCLCALTPRSDRVGIILKGSTSGRELVKVRSRLLQIPSADAMNS